MSASTAATFVIGQRWISNPEAELGLGIVSASDHRFVTISFPAAGEQRIYAKDNAPLTRVQYRIGDTVRNMEGQSLQIEELSEAGGYLTYHGRDSDNQTASWGELELDCFVQFNRPQERLFAGQIDRLRDFRLRQLSLQHQQRLAGLQTTGLIGPRVQLLDHQLYIAHEVGQRFAPRVLLADEVGLGKTIEAGLIIHQQLLKGLSERVLIVVPESLCHQWLVEMLRRFNLAFTLLDEARCQALAESESSLDELFDDDFFAELDDPSLAQDPLAEPEATSNPFDSAQLILCDQAWLTGNEERLQQALDCDWDLLVVDEAHHLEWHPQEPSPVYQKMEQLARRARGLLLLTATPEQLGLDGHFARLRLLDPDRYFDWPRFQQEQQQYRAINELVQQLLQTDKELDSDTRSQLQSLLGDDSLSLLQKADTGARQQLIDQLLDRHGTGRVLFRNTRAGIAGFPGRQLHSHPLTDSGAPDVGFADAERVQWLSQWLKQHRRHKTLIICHSAEDALDLETHLNLRGGVRSAAFHEGMSLLERDRAAAYFADSEDGAQVLVCSEIGSEGRNFQFAHHLIMFDLPLNPDLIEQRIGRLDRIGQTETVQIHVPFRSDSREQALLRWYHEGINCFERVCPVGQAVFETFVDRLLPVLSQAERDPAAAEPVLSQLIADTREHTEALLESLKAGRDRLLELNSCKPEVARELKEELQQLDDSDELAEYMNLVFDRFGVDHERHSEHAFIARPSDHMQTAHFPGLPDEGLTATCDRQQALSREDMQYLTWEHPMATGVMEMILGGEMGNTAICTLRLPPLAPGSLLVEGLLQFHCAAPKSLQLSRFVGQTCIRLVHDNNLKSLGHIITTQHFDKLGQSVSRSTGKQLVQHARADIEAIISHLEQQAEVQQAELIDGARQQLEQHYQKEIQRLQALAAVNPNIRQEEIEHLQQQRTAGLDYLQHARLRLDAIRVAVVTD